MEEFYDLLEEYKKYFSLYDELGLVQRMEINLVYRHKSVKEDIKSKSVKEDIKSKSVKEDTKSMSVKRKYENKDI